MAIGLLIGLSVNFRLPNLFLSAGYCLYFLVTFLMQRSRQSFVQGLGFGVALLIGMVPTLAANAINAGSPFSTTYGGPDTVAPALDFAVLRSYLVDLQFPLLLIAIGWTALAWRRRAKRNCLGRFGKPRRQHRLLPDPSAVHTLLYGAGSSAVALDAAVWHADGVRGRGQRSDDIARSIDWATINADRSSR